MAIRSTGSTTIAFGLVSVPVKLYTATSSHDPKFNTLHAKCGSRVKQPKQHCPECDTDVERSETQKGFEVSKGTYVAFTEEELASLRPAKFERLDIEAFVPAHTIDPIMYEKSVFVGPDKGGDRAFNLLSKALRGTERIAVGRYMSRGRVYLAALRPYQKGIIIHHLFYGDEIRDYEDVNLGEDTSFDPREEEMAAVLVQTLAKDDFDADTFTDEYRDNVAAAVKAKSEGQEIVVAPAAAATAGSVDLFEALKASLEAAKQ